MKILGIGPLEAVMFIIVILIVFRPSELVEGGKKLGIFIHKMKNSEMWSSFHDFRRSITQAGQNIINDNSIEEVRKELKKIPDLGDFRSELDQLGFIPNTISSENPKKGNSSNIGLDNNEKEESNNK